MFLGSPRHPPGPGNTVSNKRPVRSVGVRGGTDDHRAARGERRWTSLLKKWERSLHCDVPQIDFTVEIFLETETLILAFAFFLADPNFVRNLLRVYSRRSTGSRPMSKVRRGRTVSEHKDSNVTERDCTFVLEVG